MEENEKQPSIDDFMPEGKKRKPKKKTAIKASHGTVLPRRP